MRSVQSVATVTEKSNALPEPAHERTHRRINSTVGVPRLKVTCVESERVIMRSPIIYYSGWNRR